MRKVCHARSIPVCLAVAFVLVMQVIYSEAKSQCTSGNSVYFNGTAYPVKYINPAVPPNSIGDNFTIEFLAWPLGTIQAGMTASTAGVAGVANQRYVVFPDWYGTSNQAGVGVSVGTNGVAVIEHAHQHMPATLVHYTPISGWTHIAIVYVHRKPSLYINGILVTPSNNAVQSTRAVYPSANIGGFSRGGFVFETYGPFNGYIDEFRIWGAVLDANTIREWYNKPVTPSHPNYGSMERYWKFDESSGNVANDASGHGRYGTLINIGWILGVAAFDEFTYYADADGDGFGDAGTTTSTCSSAPPAGFVADKTDCDDGDSKQRPGQVWYIDADGDGYGSGTAASQCSRPVNGFTTSELLYTGGDCDDANAAIGACSADGLYALTSEGNGAIIKYDPVSNTSSSVFNFPNDGYAIGLLSGLTKGLDGNLYGMTSSGGKFGFGVIYSINPVTLSYTKLIDFDGTNGRSPTGKLLQANDGKLYGMTWLGGDNNMGVMFSFDPINGEYAKLIDFDPSRGTSPVGNLIQSIDGKFYGTTPHGGINGRGVIFSFDPGSLAYTVLFNFDQPISTGTEPYGGLFEANDGKLYGTTSSGGTNGAGVIFSFERSTSTFNKLKDFSGTDGERPEGSLMQATNGKLYGRARGGTSQVGVIFSFDPITNLFNKEKDFDHTASYPSGDLIQSSDGKLYGTTSLGGQLGTRQGNIYSFDPATSNFSIVKSFDGTNGAHPYGSLLHINGKLYGTTRSGGSSNVGVIFSFQPTTSVYSKLKDFENSNGVIPYGSLVRHMNGKLYGLTTSGGKGYGVIFSYDPVHSTYEKLKDFDGINGANPYGSLTLGSDGRLYGMTFNGGINNGGVIFSFDPSTHVFSKLKDFNWSYGVHPSGNLIQARDGKFYGMTQEGGSNGGGVIFSFEPSTSAYTILREFSYTDQQGYKPYGSLVQRSDGKLFGMTSSGGMHHYGVIFSFDPSTHSFLKMFDFDGSSGSYPTGDLIQARDGKLYGTTASGGNLHRGVMFSFNPETGVYTLLKEFSGTAGENLYGTLFQARNGKLYGMTNRGGSYGKGVLFSYGPLSSVFTKIQDFDGTNGGLPYYGGFIEIGGKAVDCDALDYQVSISPSAQLALCPGGTVTLTATEGSSYLWSTGATTREISVVSSGVFSVTVFFGDECSATSDVVTITAEDKEPPVISCPSAITKQTSSDGTGNCSTTVQLVSPEATDNCEMASVKPFVDGAEIDPATHPFSAGLTTITWVAEDVNGNTSSCIQIVTVVDDENPVVTKGAIGSCYKTVAEASAAALAATEYSDNCTSKPDLQRNVTISGDCNALVIVTVRDASANATSVIYTSRIDNVAPVFVQPPLNIFVNCNSVPPPATVTASDNCSTNVPITFEQTSTQSPDPTHGMHYNYRITRKWTAEDLCGNKSTYTQTITVMDTQTPSITCQQSQTVHLPANACSTLVNLSATSSDNCSTPVVRYYLNYGSATQTEISSTNAFTAGTYSITVEANDPSGNYNKCVFALTVKDVTPPVMNCPGNQVMPSCSTVVNSYIHLVTPVDNCSPAAAISVTQLPAAGTSIAPGETIAVTLTAVDGGGNVTTCTFNVTRRTALTISQAITAVTCNGGSDGAITLQVAGGSAPYTFNWTNGSNTKDLSGVAAGTYSVVVTDSEGCSAMLSVVITEPAPVVITASGNTTVCEGANVVLSLPSDVQVIGFDDLPANTTGVPLPSPYKGFYWTSAYQNSMLYAEGGKLAAFGSGYANSIKSAPNVAFGLMNSGNIRPVTGVFSFIGAHFTAARENQTLLFKGYKNGNLVYTSSYYNITTTASTWIQLDWNNLDDLEITSNNNTQWVFDDFTFRSGNINSTNGRWYRDNVIIPSATGGVYTATVSGTYHFATVEGCMSNAISVVVNPLPDFTVTLQNVTCAGGSDGSVTINASGGTGSFEYSINAGDTYQASPHFPGLSAGTYMIAVKDGAGCTRISQVTIIQRDDVYPVITSAVTTISANSTDDGRGDCGTTVFVDPPAIQDNCEIASIVGIRSDARSLTDKYAVGTTRVVWTATDVSGNASTFTQTINVIDNEDPVVTCAANVFHCYAISGVYAVPLFVAVDNCGVASVSWSITGATTRTGLGNDASGAFNVGNSIINWLVVDINGNQSSCVTSVTINPRLSGNITADPVLPKGVEPFTVYNGYTPASTITLTVNPAGGTPSYNYAWSVTGNLVIVGAANGQQARVTFAAGSSGDSRGTATVVIMDATGVCTHVITREIDVRDIRCGNKMDRVIVCQIPPGKGTVMQTTCAHPNSVPALLSNGAQLGACGSNNAMTNLRLQPSGTVRKMSLQAMPNPTSNYFTLLAESDITNIKMKLLVYDVLGRLVEVKQNIVSGTTFQIGERYRPGIYIGELVQGETRKKVKLVKVSE